MQNNISDEEMKDFIPDKKILLKEKTNSSISDEEMKDFIPDQQGFIEAGKEGLSRLPKRITYGIGEAADKFLDDPVKSIGSTLGVAGQLVRAIPAIPQGLGAMASEAIFGKENIEDAKKRPLVAPSPDSILSGKTDEEAKQLVKGIWHGTFDKYGSKEKATEALRKNPEDFIFDLLAVLPVAGSIAGKIPGVSKVTKTATDIAGKIAKPIIAAPERAIKATIKTIHPMGGQIDDLAFLDAMDIGAPFKKEGFLSKKYSKTWDKEKDYVKKIKENRKKEASKFWKTPIEKLENKLEEVSGSISSDLFEGRNVRLKAFSDPELFPTVERSLKKKFIGKEKEIQEALNLIKKRLFVQNPHVEDVLSFLKKRKYPRDANKTLIKNRLIQKIEAGKFEGHINVSIRDDLLNLEGLGGNKVLKEAIHSFNEVSTGKIRKGIEALNKKEYGLNYEKALNVRNTIKKHFNDIPGKTLWEGLKELGLPGGIGGGLLGYTTNPTLGIVTAIAASPMAKTIIAKGVYGGAVRVPKYIGGKIAKGAKYIAKTKAGKAGLYIGDKALSKKGVVVYNMLKKIQDAQAKLEDLKQSNKEKK